MKEGREKQNMSDTLVKCVICGKEFIQDHGKVTCSDDCKYERKLEITRKAAEKQREKNKKYIAKKLCDFCGQEYQPKNDRGRFCSEHCKNEQRKNDNAERATIRKLQKKKCRLCGKEFDAPNGEKYCSPFCRAEANRIRSRKAERVSHEPKVCVICGETFVPRFVSQEWCKRECQKKLYKRREQVRKGRPVEPLPANVSNVDAIEGEARKNGMTYGTYKAQELIDRHARVELPEWARR
jgi:predicted nucleic acid-binding Zn ribbon protein